jgi:hypothetical protein
MDVEEKDVELAFIDYFEFLVLEFDYVENKVDDLLDYGKGWKGALGEDQKCLQLLWEKGATCLEKSTTTINDYTKLITETCHVGNEAARRRYYHHKEKGWVDSKQVGKNESSIWLTFTPQFKRIKSSDKITEVYETYIEIFKKYNLLETIPPLPPLEPPNKPKKTSKKGDTTLIPPLPFDTGIKIPEGGLTL